MAPLTRRPRDSRGEPAGRLIWRSGWPDCWSPRPFVAVAAVAIVASGDRGPLLYRAKRIGEGGREITVHKLRTMRVGSTGLAITHRDDDRITPVGRVLRRFKIDELPQFLDVVRGEMSVVGPRPEDPRYVDWSVPSIGSCSPPGPGSPARARSPFGTRSGCWPSPIRSSNTGPSSCRRNSAWMPTISGVARSPATSRWWVPPSAPSSIAAEPARPAAVAAPGCGHAPSSGVKVAFAARQS